ncbi:hypothetical protein L6452_03671 [Arctium lappa]|uniref:Uncharacterized protein n=1 Tax=Arctium lappa TaxID=4217 RepID=A0ACB9FMW0_ARCLA|nr:hypothetical protein L6452_03671 [Arctium lappa]
MPSLAGRIKTKVWTPIKQFVRDRILGDDGDDNLGGGDPNIWFKDLEKHAYGEVSFAVVQANLNMEDYSQVEIGKNATFVGVYDGHGGTDASNYVCHHIFPNFIDAANERGLIHSDVIETAIATTESGFLAYVRNMFQERPLLAAVGSCCLTGVIWGRRLVVGNLGDSRAIIGTITNRQRMSVGAEQITQDQNVSRDDVRRDVQRRNPNDPHILVRAQGVWRIRGIIQVSRTIGDACLKSAEFALGPQFPQFHLQPPLTQPALGDDPFLFQRDLNEADRFIVFASDGLWEHGIARRLLKKAMKVAAKKAKRRYKTLRTIPSGDRRRAIHDDITIIVVFIDHDLLDLNNGNIGDADQVSLRSLSDSTDPSLFREMQF